MASPITSVSLPLLKKEQLTPEAYSFTFDRSSVSFDFLPGQYVSLELQNFPLEKAQQSRLLSLASAPEQKDILSFVVKKSESPFNHALRSMHRGSVVSVWGPSGYFVLPEKKDVPLVFLAGGIGMAPFLSMLRSLQLTGEKRKLTVFASFRTPEEVVYQDEVEHLSQKLSFPLIYTLTRAERSLIFWSGERGPITAALLKKYLPIPQSYQYFIAGPPLMVQSMEQLLHDLAVPSFQVKREIFAGVTA